MFQDKFWVLMQILGFGRHQVKKFPLVLGVFGFGCLSVVLDEKKIKKDFLKLPPKIRIFSEFLAANSKKLKKNI